MTKVYEVNILVKQWHSLLVKADSTEQAKEKVEALTDNGNYDTMPTDAIIGADSILIYEGTEYNEPLKPTEQSSLDTNEQYYKELKE